MNAFVGVTDKDWFELLGAKRGLEEANFWQPSGNSQFRALQPGELFLFKLHAPDNFIVGGGFFAHSTLLPVSLAWEAFGASNGAATLEEMRERVQKYRRSSSSAFEDYTIGCILLEQPFFWSREQWIPVPADWKPNIVRGRGYDLTVEPGRTLLELVRERMSYDATPLQAANLEEGPRYGSPTLVQPRLGQGSFRVLVTDAYQRRCAATGERTLPVLQAAHIKPYVDGGQHRVQNGLLLRSDLHTLYDRGYLTVGPDYRIEVSKRIRAEFSNGRAYYELHGHEISVPPVRADQPAPELLAWHAENVFRP